MSPALVPSSRLRAALIGCWASCLGVVMSIAPLAFACDYTDDMPAAVPRLIDRGLSQEDYRERAVAWRAYAEAHPTRGLAWVELERALRYSRQIQGDAQLEMLRRAVEADPDCSPALDRLASLEFEHSVWGDRSRLSEARQLAQRARAAAPASWEPHQTLWVMDVATGVPNQEDMVACLEKGAFPSPLLDYAYNMLSTAAPQALLFTNGDHDTFPLLALQARYGLRPDVRVINLSMASFPDYAKMALNGGAPPHGPLSNADIDHLHENREPGIFLGRAILSAVAARVADGSCQRPVYAAVTVAQLTQMIPNRLDMQGLLFRVSPEIPAADVDAVHIDVARTDSLYEFVYRMESAMDLGYDWQATPAITQLMGNYVGGYRHVLAAHADNGDLEAARRTLRNILPFFEFHQQLRHGQGRDRAALLLTYWQELDPDNPEVDRWRQRLDL